MLRLTAALCVLGISAVAQTGEDIAHCANVGDVAAVIMDQRQSGVRASAVIAAVTDLAKEGGTTGETETQIIMLAYEEPRWNSPEMKARAVEDFSVQIELECIQQRGG